MAKMKSSDGFETASRGMRHKISIAFLAPVDKGACVLTKLMCVVKGQARVAE
jgi:hypothetical protein